MEGEWNGPIYKSAGNIFMFKESKKDPKDLEYIQRLNEVVFITKIVYKMIYNDLQVQINALSTWQVM